MTHPSSSFLVSRLRELLAEAVECLDHRTSNNHRRCLAILLLPSRTQIPADYLRLSADRHHQTLALLSPGCTWIPTDHPLRHVAGRMLIPDSAPIECSCLFNYKRKTYSRKGKSVCSGTSKKKLNTWVHDFVCRSRTDQEWTPDPMERTALISAGKVCA